MWTLRSDDRLKEWKEFRRQIGTLPFDEAVTKTVNLWSYAPFVSHYLDQSEPRDWPTPWELISDNNYDDTAKALGMLFTIYLSQHGKDHTFQIVKAKNGLENYSLVSIDEGKYILNFTFNEVVSKIHLDRDSVETIQTYSDSDLQLAKY